jgi:DNA repair photolyase
MPKEIMLNAPVVSAKNFMTKTGLGADFVCNPYLGCTHGCLYCYARFMGMYDPAAAPWGTYVKIKEFPNYDIPNNTGAKSLLFSSVTDPYQPIEATAKRTRMALENTYESRLQFRFLTKSALIVRDLDLFRQMHSVEIGFSIALDDETAKIVEPGASLPSARIAALKTIHAAGIRTWVFIAPILPYITDVFAILEKVKADADYILVDYLNLKSPENRANIYQYIFRFHPELLPKYKQIFEGNDRSYYDQLAQEIRAYGAQNQLDITITYPASR